MIRTDRGFAGRPEGAPERQQASARRDSARRIQKSDGVGAVVLAGVHHWGGSVLDQTLPRPLLPIANRPLITYALDWLGDAGLNPNDICVCANSSTTAMKEHLVRGFKTGRELHYYEDVMPRGPAGCVHDAWVGCGFKTLVVVDGTVVPRLDLGDLLKAHESDGSVMTVVVTSKHKPGRPSDDLLIPTGIYLFDRRALEYVPATGYQDIKEKLIPRLYSSGERLNAYVSNVPVPRVVGRDSYLSVNDWVVETMVSDAELPNGYHRNGEALVHSFASLDKSVRLIGPVVVGEGTRLERNVTIVGPTTVGRDCYVDAGAVISRSSIWDHAAVGAGAVLDRCVLAYDALVEPEAALRFVVWTEEGRRVPLLSSIGGFVRGESGRREHS